MSGNVEKLVQETISRAYLPDTIKQPGAVVERALEIFADNLSGRGTRRFAEWIGGDMRSRLEARSDKVERSVDDMIDLLAADTGVTPSIADDLLGNMFEALWHVLDREQMDEIIAQLPAECMRAVMAAIPGEARGHF